MRGSGISSVRLCAVALFRRRLKLPEKTAFVLNLAVHVLNLVCTAVVLNLVLYYGQIYGCLHGCTYCTKFSTGTHLIHSRPDARSGLIRKQLWFLRKAFEMTAIQDDSMDVLDDTKFTAVLNLVLVHVSDEHQNKYKYSCSIAMRSFMTWQYFYSRTPTRVLSPYTLYSCRSKFSN